VRSREANANNFSLYSMQCMQSVSKFNCYFSQLNQAAGSNYYAPQAASQLRQQHSFQQAAAIVAPQSVAYSQVWWISLSFIKCST